MPVVIVLIFSSLIGLLYLFGTVPVCTGVKVILGCAFPHPVDKPFGF